MCSLCKLLPRQRLSKVAKSPSTQDRHLAPLQDYGALPAPVVGHFPALENNGIQANHCSAPLMITPQAQPRGRPAIVVRQPLGRSKARHPLRQPLERPTAHAGAAGKPIAPARSRSGRSLASHVSAATPRAAARDSQKNSLPLWSVPTGTLGTAGALGTSAAKVSNLPVCSHLQTVRAAAILQGHARRNWMLALKLMVHGAEES